MTLPDLWQVVQKYTVHKQYIYDYADCKISFSALAGKRALGVKKVADCSHADMIISWRHTPQSYQK